MPSKCKITVLKKELNKKLALEHCQNEVSSCPRFVEGQEFIAGFSKPEELCDWAWNDIYRIVAVLLAGGNFSSDNY